MRHHFPLALGIIVVASSLSLAAQTTKSHTSSMKKSPQTAATKAAMTTDQQFVTEAYEGGMAEVALGQLATEKASNAKVKDFGQRMMTDHGKANDELKALAASKNITLPTKLNAKQQATKDRLSKLSGSAFDRAYVNDMVKDHQADSAAFHKEASSGQDPEIKAWAAKTGVVVDEHLKMVQDIQKELGTSKPTQ
jgi:putative membrane protein